LCGIGTKIGTKFFGEKGKKKIETAKLGANQ
jgi:hypothetical protein